MEQVKNYYKRFVKEGFDEIYDAYVKIVSILKGDTK